VEAAYTNTISAITPVADGSLTHDRAVGVGFTVRFDVAGAAAGRGR